MHAMEGGKYISELPLHTHELRNEVSSADLMPPSRSTFLKEVEMVYS